MTGMDRYTGKALDELAHIRQSIADILSTRLGVRVMRRAYGSRLYTLVDDPVDQRFRVEVQAAVAEAVRRWEPRVTPERVLLRNVGADGPVFQLDIRRRRDGQRAQLTI